MVKKYKFEDTEYTDELVRLIRVGGNSEDYISRNGRLWASDSTECHLRGVIESNFSGFKPSNSSKSFLVKSGLATEDAVISNVYDSSLLFQQYRLPNVGLNLGGKVDVISHLNDKIFIVEVKEKTSLPAKPLKSHLAQASIYSAILGLPAIVLYVQRVLIDRFQELQLKAFQIDNAQRYKHLLNAVRVNIFNKRKLLPTRPDYMKKTYCRNNYCSHYDSCWEGADNYLDWNIATFEDEEKIDIEANKVTEQMLDESVINDRTRGVLKHLSVYGTEYAKDILKNKSWDGYIGN